MSASGGKADMQPKASSPDLMIARIQWRRLLRHASDRPQREKVRASAAFEVGDAPLFGGLDAFLEVFGGAQPRLLGQFVVGGGQDAVG